MPHVHLETTSNIHQAAHVPEILELLVQELCRHDTITSSAVKAYHTLRPVWVMGDGAPAGFVHCTVAILSGRPLELRQRISAAMVSVLRQAYSEAVESGEAGITLELREMDKDTYQK